MKNHNETKFKNTVLLLFIIVDLILGSAVRLCASDFDNLNNYSKDNQLVAATYSGIDMHHVFPQIYRSEFVAIFGADIIDNYTVSVDCSIHRAFSYQYNQDWESFLSVNGNPSAAQTMAFAEMLSYKYGYGWPF